MIIGLTGGIATGKSTVARLLRESGMQVLSADELAHQVMEPEGPAYAAVLREFGPEILTADGRIDRKQLGRIVFTDPQRRRKLESLVHPPVIAVIQKAITEHRANHPGRILLVEVPLLFEAGMAESFDRVLVVSASPEAQQRRLQERDGLKDAEIGARIASQMPLAEKEAQADNVIVNNGSRDDLRRQTAGFLQGLEDES
jgi:dephospho-CoA kinase